MCLPCLLPQWFNVASLRKAVTQVFLASLGLHRFPHVLFILPSLTRPLPSLYSPPEGRQVGVSGSQLHCWYYPAVCPPADPPPAPAWVEGLVARDMARSSSVFISLWFSVKCCARSDTTAENCLPLVPTSNLSALIVWLQSQSTEIACAACHLKCQRDGEELLIIYWNAQITWGLSWWVVWGWV